MRGRGAVLLMYHYSGQICRSTKCFLTVLCMIVGDCLITVATGPLSDSDADRAGLVSTHAYALLDMRKVQVSFVCMTKKTITRLGLRIMANEDKIRNGDVNRTGKQMRKGSETPGVYLCSCTLSCFTIIRDQ